MDKNMDENRHTLEIQNFGLLHNCKIPMYDLLVFTGPQASGKSTIVRAVYFFRSIKDELCNLIAKDEIRADKVNVEHELQSALKTKLRNLFGPSFAMAQNSLLRYCFAENITVTVTLSAEKYFNIDFSQQLRDAIYNVVTQSLVSQMNSSDFERVKNRVYTIFNDDKEVVFIPAGRSMITLLTDVLNYFMLQTDKDFSEKIDYSTREFLRVIIKARPFFTQSEFSLGEKPGELKSKFRLLREESESLLGGVYKYEGLEERLYYNARRYVKINFSSSGQQEALWLLNIMQMLTYEGKKVLLIVEEPEAHLYPDAQAKIMDMLSVFADDQNSLIITTHSPYILAELNVLLLCGKLEDDSITDRIHKRKWMVPKRLKAFHINGGESKDALSDTDGLVINELIDGVSDTINENFDLLFEKYLENSREAQ